MTVTPYNPGQYLVTSRTRAEVEHLVDITTGECSCEAALDFKTTTPDHPCAHVEAVYAFIGGAKPHRPRPSSPLAIFSARHDD